MTFREEIDHRRTKSCLAATPGSDTSLFLRLNLSAHKTGLCPSVTNNQEGTGGGTLVLSNVRACVCTRVVPSSNSVVMGDQISMVWEWSHTHTDTQCVCQRLSPSWTSANRLSAIWWGSDTNGSRREILKKKKKKDFSLIIGVFLFLKSLSVMIDALFCDDLLLCVLAFRSTSHVCFYRLEPVTPSYV